MGHPEPPVAGTPPSPPPPPRERKWIPALAVLGIILFVSLGGFFAAADVTRSFGEAPAPSPGTPRVVVGEGVSVLPVPGWEESRRYHDPEGVRLTNGSGTLDIFAVPGRDSPESLLAEYVDQALAPQASRVEVGTSEPVAVDSGFPAARASYVGVFGEQAAAIEGEVTAAVAPGGVGIVFDGWSQEGVLGFLLDEIRRMVSGVSVG